MSRQPLGDTVVLSLLFVYKLVVECDAMAGVDAPMEKTRRGDVGDGTLQFVNP